MPQSAVKLSWALLWAAAGIGFSWVAFKSLRSSVERLTPESQTQVQPIGRMIFERLLRFLILAALLYFAVRMNVVYAFIAATAFTVARWVQVLLYNKSLDKPVIKEEPHGNR